MSKWLGVVCLLVSDWTGLWPQFWTNLSEICQSFQHEF